jgi:hypothetical protein
MSSEYLRNFQDLGWSDTLLWGQCKWHWQKAQRSNWSQRAIHVILTVLEFLPVISQIVSIFERIFSETYHHFYSLENRSIEVIPTRNVLHSPNVQNLPSPHKISQNLDVKQSNSQKPNSTIPETDSSLSYSSIPHPLIAKVAAVSQVEINVDLTPTLTQGKINSDSAIYPLSILQEPLKGCGAKCNALLQTQNALEKSNDCFVPRFFGLAHEQIVSLLSLETLRLWQCLQDAYQLKEDLDKKSIVILLEKMQRSVKQDILHSKLPLTEEQKSFLSNLGGKTLIIRSSSNEDGLVVNAGGNESIAGVGSNEESIRKALATVVASYFSLKSFKGRLLEHPFKTFPLCSALVMEQIIEDKFPITSGVMMTSKTAWSSSNESGIVHIAASWGFGGGTSNRTICDEWALVDANFYATIRTKPSRISTCGQRVVNNDDCKSRPCLELYHLKKLQTIAKRIEAYFGKPMDVEFVVKGDYIYIVQAREIQAPHIQDSNYLDPTKIPSYIHRFQGEMIVTSDRVMSLERGNILFAKDLAEAERNFIEGDHKVVVVYTPESSNTHPAVNFSSRHPLVPCLRLDYSKWVDSSQIIIERSLPWQLCSQTGTLIHTHHLQVSSGLFFHPAHFPVSIGEERAPLHGQSSHPRIKNLIGLLNKTPEEIGQHIEAMKENFDNLFQEIFSRRAMTELMRNRGNQLKEAVSRELDAIATSYDQRKMSRLAFHAGILRQILTQSGSDALGTDSVAGLESITQMPAHIEEFVQRHSANTTICELALAGSYGFDEQIQKQWLAFLEKEHSVEQLQGFLLGLRKLIALEIATEWFSNYFSSENSFPIELLLREINNRVTAEKSLQTYREQFKAIEGRMQRASSINALTDAWKDLEIASKDFLAFSNEKKLQSSLLIDLINLWDMSAKIVLTSHLFSLEEETQIFEKRVQNFKQFAENLERSGLLNYSIQEVLSLMDRGGREGSTFSVQHWLIPISRGALAYLKTADQKLTVIHQNLLQAAAYGKVEQLPKNLKTTYGIFKQYGNTEAKRFSGDQGVYIAISKEEASVKINIPLNFHSTVVTFSQKKGKEEIDATIYFRASDNDRTGHAEFFQMFSNLTGVPLKDVTALDRDLKVVFTIKNEREAILLSRAIRSMNSMTLTNINYLRALTNILLDPNEESEAKFQKKEEEILEHFWGLFRNSGVCFSSLRYDLVYFLTTKNRLSELTTFVLQELKGERPKNDFSHHIFVGETLKELPVEEAKILIENDLRGEQTIDVFNIPENIREELLLKLFEEYPLKALTICTQWVAAEIFKEKLSLKLESKEGLTLNERKLLFVLAADKGEPFSALWIQELKTWKEKDKNSFNAFVREEQNRGSVWKKERLEKLLETINSWQ